MGKNTGKWTCQALAAATMLTVSGLSIAMPPPADWQVNIGLGVGFAPEYRGADE